jgi:hypothetical protein
MATAKRIAPPTPTIELLITEEEARFIKDVMSNIGGDSETSRRRFANSISDALGTLGFKTSDNVADIADSASSIYFKEIK